jgi:exonuclease III
MLGRDCNLHYFPVEVIAGAANNYDNMVPLSISAQNVNSLNISSSLENWELKVGAIKNMHSDIIFLSDLRLKRKDGFDISNKLGAAMLRGTGRKYDIWSNSNLSNRGVAILIARDIDAEVLDGMEDEQQNIIALKLKIKNVKFILVSIYGPNGACEKFFPMLTLFISKLKEKDEQAKIIIGGDWNTVIDGSPVAENPDLHLMKTFPNHSQHLKLIAFMEKFDLTDPYRIYHPDGGEFSCAPFGTLRSNRSRLDFFLVSRPVLPTVLESKIVLGRLCKLFDHSSINQFISRTEKIYPK